MINQLSTTLYSTLTGGTALTALLSGTAAIYNTRAPDNATLPFVVFSYQAGAPLNINPSDLREELLYIRGYTLTSMGYAGSIDAAISNLIHKQSLSVSGYTNYFTVREQEFALADTQPDGVTVYTAGAYYRISLDA